MSNQRYLVRKFLDPQTLTMASVERTPSYGKSPAEYELTLRDCSRQIHMIFPADKRGMDKLKKLQDILALTREKMENERR